MTEWHEPDLDTKYVLCDDDGNAVAVCTFLDMVGWLTDACTDIAHHLPSPVWVAWLTRAWSTTPVCVRRSRHPSFTACGRGIPLGCRNVHSNVHTKRQGKTKRSEDIASDLCV